MNTRLYTVDETISNLVLLEPHFRGLSEDKLWCMDCITKHTYAIRGLGDEGVKFFSENPEPWRKATSWAIKVLDMGDLNPEQGETLADEASELRKGVFVPIAKAERGKGSTELTSLPTEDELRKIVAAGGGVYTGLQERITKTGQQRTPCLLFNDPEGRTLSSILLDPEIHPITAEAVRDRIEEKRREVPAPDTKHELGAEHEQSYCPLCKDVESAVKTCEAAVKGLEGLARIEPYLSCMKRELKGADS